MWRAFMRWLRGEPRPLTIPDTALLPSWAWGALEREAERRSVTVENLIVLIVRTEASYIKWREKRAEAHF